MYRPTPIEMYNYDEYKEYIKNMIHEIEEDNKKDKEEIEKYLDDYRENVGVASVSDDGYYWRQKIVSRNTDSFIEAVGLSNKVYLRNTQYKKLLDELDFLNTDKGKEAYINKMGRYSNIELL